MRHFWILALCLAMWSMAHTRALADTRVALVIGNGAYRILRPQLPNPPHDARALRDSLEGLGFDVELGLDLTRDQMDAAVIRFARKARQADVALVFFGGHGIQHKGINYLAPVDAEVKDEADLRRFPTAQQIVEDLQAAKNVRILILDACRDNRVVEQMASQLPPSRAISFSRGLGRMDKAEGTLIAFSTQPNTVADDGSGANSPFMLALLKHLPEPGVDVRLVFARARADVFEETRHEQLPELSDSLVGEFTFKQAAPISPPVADPETSARNDFDLAKQIGTVPAWDAFLAHHPTGFLADLAKGERSKLTSASISPVQPIKPPAAPPAESEQPAVRPAQIPIAPIAPKPIVPGRKPEPTFAAPKPKPPATQETRETPKSAKCFVFNGNKVCE
jgi:hypothetical protein